jgi:hypothetical protein
MNLRGRVLLKDFFGGIRKQAKSIQKKYFAKTTS